jgi:hypothetical protein
MPRVIHIDYKELAIERGDISDSVSQLPSLRDAVSTHPQKNEDAIIQYLKGAPNYCAMGKVVRDVIDPENKALLYPGTNTDGLYLWPLELAYYVQKYHISLPHRFLERMAGRNWRPPLTAEMNWESLFAAAEEL